VKIRSLALILFIISFIGCTSLTFIPRQGNAAKFNLATVAYVDSALAREERNTFRKIIESQQSFLDSLFAQQSEEISSIKASIAGQQTNLNELATNITALNRQLDSLQTAYKAIISLAKVNSRQNQQMQAAQDSLAMVLSNTRKTLIGQLEQYIASLQALERKEQAIQDSLGKMEARFTGLTEEVLGHIVTALQKELESQNKTENNQ